MRDTERRRRDTFVRVQGFGNEHVADFPAGGVAAQLFTSLTATINQLDGHAASQSSNDGIARQGTTTKSQARQALREDLEAISRTARAMSDDVPGLDDKFRLPRVDNDSTLLNSARAFAGDAAPLSAQFIAHELPADFLATLNANINAFQTSVDTQASGVGQRITAGTAIDEAIETGMAIVRKLDALVKNKYAHNRAILAEWTSASHTERGPHHVPKPSTGSGATPPASP
ncbi:MAG: hypothetical protein QOD75_3535 [Blastocatellia bacterium]|jgi:hypothetical protein|nr:hypothetical protein [Blastocatellia bacterium]